MTDETVHEYVRRSREEQGLPPTIDDPATLRAVAAILADALQERSTAA